MRGVEEVRLVSEPLRLRAKKGVSVVLALVRELLQ